MVKQGDKVGLYLSGMPVPIPDCNIILTQPKIKDIVSFGEDDFLNSFTIFTTPEIILEQVREGNPLLESFSDFQLLLVMIEESEEFNSLLLGFLEFVFPDYEIQLTDSSIEFYITQDEQKIMIGMVNPFNFEGFQKILSDVFGIPKKDSDKPDYNPANEAAAEIAKKLMKGRKNAAKAKGDDKPQSLFARYASVLSIGLQVDINIFFDYTPFQLYDAFLRYFDKKASDEYFKVATTPLMDVSKMKEPED